MGVVSARYLEFVVHSFVSLFGALYIRWVGGFCVS